MRMLREARSLARFSHPGIVEIYEVGTTGHGPFIVMELVSGRTLRAWMEAEHDQMAVVQMFLQAARALGAAHRMGVVHRDIKPDNAIVDEGGRLEILDFGLARSDTNRSVIVSSVGRSVDSDVGLTRTGMIVGTPAYLAPECHEGRAADGRADQPHPISARRLAPTTLRSRSRSRGSLIAIGTCPVSGGVASEPAAKRRRRHVRRRRDRRFALAAAAERKSVIERAMTRRSRTGADEGV
jgi:serine/threonine protein kinase